MLEKMNGLFLDLIIHPGETIKEILEDKEMTQTELATRTKFSAKHVSEVISGKKNISSAFANQLEYALGVPTSFWINLQGIYDKEILELEKQNNIDAEEFEILNELSEIVKYCEKNDIISSEGSKSIKLLNMRRFLNINDLKDISNLPMQQVAFRGSTKIKVNNYVLYAWQKICQHFTGKVTIENNFNKRLLETKLTEIKKTMFLEPNEMITKLKEIFKECGIAFEVVKHFTGAPVQGFIQKRKEKVILCLTIRNSFSDIFWFTLFHEIAHLINDDVNDLYIDYTFIESAVEKNADTFARNTLIPEGAYQNFKNNNKFDKKSIINFAKEYDIVPGILIGRIQKDTNDYSFFANLRERYIWSNTEL